MGISSAASPSYAVKENQEDFQARFLEFIQNNNIANEDEKDGYGPESDIDIFEPIVKRPKIITSAESEYFNPNTLMIELDKKDNDIDKLLIDETKNTDDGVFHNVSQKISHTNLIRLRERLILDDPNKLVFFNENGKVKDDTPIIRTTPLMPHSKEYLHEAREENLYHFIQPRLLEVGSLITSRIVCVEVSKISFLVHELSSQANILSARMIQIYKTYLQSKHLDLLGSLEKQIKTYREYMKTIKTNREDALREVLELQDKRDAEEQRIRSIKDTLLEIWHMLKKEQEASVTVPYVLKWTAQRRNESETQFEKVRHEREFQKRAEEICELSQIHGIVKDPKDVVEELRQKHYKMGLRLPGSTVWEPVMKQQQVDSQIPQSEVIRRSKIDSVKLFISIRVGKTVAFSKDFRLNYDMTAEPNIGVKMECNVVPGDVVVEIWERNGLSKNCLGSSKIAVVNGIPSEPMSTSFSGNCVLKDGRITHGMIYARSFVEPDEEFLNTVSPTRTNYEINKRSLERNTATFLSVPQFALSNRNMDPNCPYLTEALVKSRAMRQVPRYLSSFKLDECYRTTTFEAIAPTNFASQLPMRAFDIQTVPKSKIEREDAISFNSFGIFEFWHSLKNAFRRRRPLQVAPVYAPPTYKITPKTAIMMQVVSASGAPSRLATKDPHIKPLSGDGIAPRLFVRIMFGTFTEITDVLSLSNSQWRESFGLPLLEFVKRQDFESALSASIRIDLFDHIDYAYDQAELISENRFLATIEIPISGIISNGSINGKIPFFTHPLIFGYSLLNKPLLLDLALNLRPAVVLKNEEWPDPDEDNDIAQIARGLLAKGYQTMALGPNGKFELICKALRPMSPPDGFDTVGSVIRFVSMIPLLRTRPGALIKIREAKRIMKSLNATRIEHSVLLQNFFSFMKEKSFVVLSHDLIYGETAFVLLFKDEEKKLIDPVFCRTWKVDDKNCPAFRISTVFNSNNIWLNAQKEDSAPNIDFDLEGRGWHKMLIEDLEEMERIDIEFGPPLPESAENLKKEVEQAIETAVEDFRGERPEFIQKIGNWMEKALKKCENAALSGRPYDFSRVASAAALKFPGLIINGCPFCVTASDGPRLRETAAEIRREIRLRETFFSPAPNLKFARAAAVFPYPNRVFAVWAILVSVQSTSGTQ